METEARPAPGPGDLRTLRVLGLVAPLVFVGVLLSLRPVLFEHYGHEPAAAMLGTALFVAALAFGLIMYSLLDRAAHRAALAERNAAALLERERLARELHDSLAQVLGVAHLKLAGIQDRPSTMMDARTQREVAELSALCHEAYRDVREAIWGLKDAARPDRTFLQHLDTYVAAFSRTSGIQTEFVADTTDLALAPDAEVQVLRVVQEALTNARKHSGARRASVHVRSVADVVQFVVADDGAGFDPHHARDDGYGLSTMRERTESVAGRLRIETAPGHGTRVVVHLPGRPGVRLDPTQELSA